MHICTNVHLRGIHLTCTRLFFQTQFARWYISENISAHSYQFWKSQHNRTICKYSISGHTNHFLISQHIRTCVIYIYAPKHIMPSIIHALSLYTHTRSAHIHARNLFTFMQRYLYCAPCGARIGVWCWKTPCGQHVAVHSNKRDRDISWRLLVLSASEQCPVHIK